MIAIAPFLTNLCCGTALGSMILHSVGKAVGRLSYERIQDNTMERAIMTRPHVAHTQDPDPDPRGTRFHFISNASRSCSPKIMHPAVQSNRPGFAHFPDRPKESCGTTIVAVEYEGGVVIGADSRTSNGGYVTNRFTDKLTEITPHIFCCRCGHSCDTQAVTDFVKHKYEVDQIAYDYPESVHRAAVIFQKWLHYYRDEMNAGILVAGWDENKGGQIYCVPQGGALFRKRAACDGSGSTFVQTYVDTKFREGMTRDAAEKLVLHAVVIAMQQDGSSGGLVRIGTINSKGIERKFILPDQLPNLEQAVYYEED